MKTVIATVALVAALGAAEDTKFTSVYRAPATEGGNFAGRKVVALVIADDESLRMSAEESLARLLTARGLKATAAWRMIPREELRDKDKVRRWFEQIGVEGAVVLRPIQMERTVTEYAPQWTTSYYNNFWGYYGTYGYGVVAAYEPAHKSVDTIVVVETLVYNVTRDVLLWAAVSQTNDPKSMDAYMKQLVSDVAKEMQKAGLVKK